MVRCQLGWKPPLPNLLDPPFAQGKGREGKRPTDADVVVILSSSLLLSIRNSHPGSRARAGRQAQRFEKRSAYQEPS